MRPAGTYRNLNTHRETTRRPFTFAPRWVAVKNRTSADVKTFFFFFAFHQFLLVKIGHLPTCGPRLHDFSKFCQIRLFVWTVLPTPGVDVKSPPKWNKNGAISNTCDNSFAKNNRTPSDKNFHDKNFCLILAKEFIHPFDHLILLHFCITSTAIFHLHLWYRLNFN